ncbi:hypothetical protein HYT02_03675 [Candidatus Gottesmanbacteria bacterium]|nr:hypothetical protein [Candidatus Gottesmanbacteria bacterium]
MKKVNLSTKYMGKFAGKWVAINPNTDRIIAVAETLKEISPFVAGKVNEKDEIKAAAFKVPRKDEGPYVLKVTKRSK